MSERDHSVGALMETRNKGRPPRQAQKLSFGGGGGLQPPPHNRQRWQKTLSVVEGRVPPPANDTFLLSPCMPVNMSEMVSVGCGGADPSPQPTAVAENSVSCSGCPSTPRNRQKLANHPDKKESASEAIDDGSASGLTDWKSLHRRIKKQSRYEPLPACKYVLTRHQDTPNHTKK